jgi:transposase-like protein
MALAGDWAKVERYARLGQLGGYQNKTGKPRAYKRGMPKLTPELQDALLAEYAAQKCSVKALAARYGITPSYVCILAKRRGVAPRQSTAARAAKSRAAHKRHLKDRMRRLRTKLGG